MKWERKISKRFYHETINGKKYSSSLSLLGISVGCFAMVISLSVMNGFESLVHEKLKGFVYKTLGPFYPTPIHKIHKYFLLFLLY